MVVAQSIRSPPGACGGGHAVAQGTAANQCRLREADRWSGAGGRRMLRTVDDRPYFLWDVPVTEAELRLRLRDSDPAIRAQWQACVLREARYEDVWRYLTLDDVLRDWAQIERHLGRRRAFWRYLLDGWRKDGLLPAA